MDQVEKLLLEKRQRAAELDRERRELTVEMRRLYDRIRKRGMVAA